MAASVGGRGDAFAGGAPASGGPGSRRWASARIDHAWLSKGRPSLAVSSASSTARLDRSSPSNMVLRYLSWARSISAFRRCKASDSFTRPSGTINTASRSSALVLPESTVTSALSSRSSAASSWRIAISQARRDKTPAASNLSAGK